MTDCMFNGSVVWWIAYVFTRLFDTSQNGMFLFFSALLPQVASFTIT